MTSPVNDVTSCVTTYDREVLDLPTETLDRYDRYKLLVDLYVISTLCAFGFVGNVISICVLHSNRHERSGTTTFLLQTLAAVDTSYLLTCLIIQPIKVHL